MWLSLCPSPAPPLPWTASLLLAVMLAPVCPSPCRGKPLPLLSPQASLSMPTLTQTTASSPAQSAATVTKSSGTGIKVGGVTLSPGMTLTQKHIQHLQQIMVHAQQLAASHKSQAGAPQPQPGNWHVFTLLPCQSVLCY